jgi:hypothetical protein
MIAKDSALMLDNEANSLCGERGRFRPAGQSNALKSANGYGPLGSATHIRTLAPIPQAAVGLYGNLAEEVLRPAANCKR